jgi:hypothetical protein
VSRFAAVIAISIALIGTACDGNNTRSDSAAPTTLTTLPATSAPPGTEPPTTESPPTTEPQRVVEFTSPKDGATVPPEVTPRGTAENMAGEKFWIVLLLDSNHYPQRGPVQVRSDNSWKAPKVFIGGPQDSGTDWEILAVAADTSKARKWFIDYLARGKRTGDFPPKEKLPGGTATVGSVAVTRK